MNGDSQKSTATDDKLVLTDVEARVLCALSRKVRSLRQLRAILGVSTNTLDRIVWRNRRVKPETMARFRCGLRRAASEHLPLVHVGEGTH
jgi:hypothetical protein